MCDCPRLQVNPKNRGAGAFVRQRNMVEHGTNQVPFTGKWSFMTPHIGSVEFFLFFCGIHFIPQKAWSCLRSMTPKGPGRRTPKVRHGAMPISGKDMEGHACCSGWGWSLQRPLKDTPKSHLAHVATHRCLCPGVSWAKCAPKNAVPASKHHRERERAKKMPLNQLLKVGSCLAQLCA